MSPQPLPNGWSCHISKSTGKNFYFNKKTGNSVWDIEELLRQSKDKVQDKSDSPRSVQRQSSSPCKVLEKRIPTSDEPESLSVKDLMARYDSLKTELGQKLSGGLEDRLTSLEGLESIPPSTSTSGTDDGLRSGIGNKLRRKVDFQSVNLFQGMKQEPTESKKIKLDAKDSVDNLIVELLSNDDITPVTEQARTDNVISEDVTDKDRTDNVISEDEDDLYGADPDEIEALAKMKDQFSD